MMMMMVAQKLMGPAMWTFGLCSRLPIRLESKMTRAEEERMARLGGSSSSYSREEGHI